MRAQHRLSKLLLRLGRRRTSQTKAWGQVHWAWLDAQRGFRKLRGYKSMPDLVRALGTIDTLDQKQHQAA